MKKALLFSTLMALLPLASWAVNAPVAENGQSLQTIDFVGCQYASIDNSTGTSLVILNSTGTGALSNGPCIVYAVITSSVNQSDYLVLRDTTGASSTGGASLAAQTGTGSLQSVASTVAVISNTYQNIVTTTTLQPNFPPLNLIKLPVPIQFNYGILANVSAAPVTSNGFARWTILYRKLNSSER